MAYQVLSRKWRPQKFQDVVGQDHITGSLQNAITSHRIGHAYILTGTRGIGKTSVARLFAKSLRCLDRAEDGNSCGKCKSCLDFNSGSSMNIFEIDGASNNSVDNMRELVQSVQTLPTFGQYKVYIIDEVHMLSTSAFNALLKTLEEPPSHVVFILATTEPQKLLSTVLSRCQRFDFRNASEETLAKHIKSIAQKEGITFESDHLVRILATQGNGSFRDTLSLFDQVLSFCEDNFIDEATLSTSLGIAKISSIRRLCASILTYDAQGVSDSFREMILENISIENMSRAILDYFYEVIQKIEKLESLSLGDEVIRHIKSLTIDEVFWVYESLSQDLRWGIDSLSPQKTVEVILQKHAKRNQILYSSGRSLGIAKENNEKVKKKVEKKTWELFESYLRKISPTLLAELEQGNITSPLALSEQDVHIGYGFSGQSKLFYEHFTNGENRKALESLMSDFFKVSKATIDLKWIEEEEAKEKSFISKSELMRRQREKDLEKQRQQIKEHPVIREAERIFNVKVKKINLNEE